LNLLHKTGTAKRAIEGKDRGREGESPNGPLMLDFPFSKTNFPQMGGRKESFDERRFRETFFQLISPAKGEGRENNPESASAAAKSP